MINPVGMTANVVSAALERPAATAPSSASAFSEFLVSAGQTLKAQLDTAESVSMQSLNGGFDPRAVADAVMSAERSLQTAVVIRDKLVAAYLDISRMAI
jgi:flagellar hook-basal body complex protein FliE